MKTIEEIKNEVAVKHGYKKWNHIPSIKETLYVDEVATEYAKQCCDEQKQAIADKLLKECKSKTLADHLYSEVLNTPNVVTTNTK